MTDMTGLGEACPTLSASFLTFLQDDLLLPSDHYSMDPGTLAAVTSTLQPELHLRPVDEQTRKRLTEADSGSDEEDARADNCCRDSKRCKSEGSSVARSKATREKARRDKINERFAELSTLIEPSKEPKTDKPTILADAVKYVHQMRVENQQLKQLNKFLEERMAQFERERGHHLYQYSLLMQHGGMMPGMIPGMGLPTPGSMAGPSSMPPSMLQTAQAAQAAHAVVNGLHAQGGGGSGFSAGPSGAPADSSNLMQQLPSISPSPPPQPPYAPPPPPYNPAQPSYNPPQPPYNNQQGYDNGTSCQQSYSNGSSQQGQGSVAGEAGPSNGVSGMPGMLGAGMGNVTSGKGLFLAGLGAQYLGSMSGGLPPGLGSGMPGMLGAGMGLGAPPFWGMHSQMHNSLKDSLLRPPAA